jgi:hypothetical protein
MPVGECTLAARTLYRREDIVSDDKTDDFLPFEEEYVWQKPNRPRQMRTQRLMPPEAYVHRADGLILTAWGDLLPNIEQSRKHLGELRLRFAEPVDSREVAGQELLEIVEVNIHTGCWTVPKRLHVITGYVPIHVKGEGHPLDFHRLMYALTRGDLRKGRQWHLDHKCMNKPCGMPLHLEYETCAENTRRGRLAHEIVNLIQMGQADLFDH